MKMKRLQCTILALLFAIACTGCGEKSDNTANINSDTPVALVIIAGRHANAKMYSEKMIEDAADIIERSYIIGRTSDGYSGTAQISVIVNDGNPETVPVELDGNSILSYTSNNADNIRESKNTLVANLKEFLLSPTLMADDEEADLLLALTRAQSILNEYPDCEHHILILDSGITTTGTLDMNRIKVLSEDNADIVKQVKSGIPDFNGTKITFYGLGNVAGKQSTITSNDGRKKFEQLWEEIFKVGGGSLTNTLNFKDVENTAEMLYSEDDGENVYPMVSNVSFYNQIPEEFESDTITIKPPAPPEKEYVSFVFNTSDLGGFKPDSDEFLRKDVAISTLNSVKDKIEACLNGDDAPILYVVGSIAKTEPDSSQRTSQVSYNRAKAVIDLLVNDYQVPADRVQLIDAGTTVFTWRNAEEFPDGVNKDPIAAQNNRVVAIISSNTDSLVEELRREEYVD